MSFVGAVLHVVFSNCLLCLLLVSKIFVVILYLVDRLVSTIRGITTYKRRVMEETAFESDVCNESLSDSSLSMGCNSTDSDTSYEHGIDKDNDGFINSYSNNCLPSTISHLPAIKPRIRGSTLRVRVRSDSSEDTGSDSEVETERTEIEDRNNVSCNNNSNSAIVDEVKQFPATNSPPADYFYLLFTEPLLDTFVKYTNLYAEQFMTSNSESSHSKTWKPITRQEILAFIVVILNMRLNIRPTIYMYWDRRPSQFMPWFCEMFSRNRFLTILKFFHMVDISNIPRSGQPGYDPYARFQNLIEHFNRVSEQHFIANEGLDGLIVQKHQGLLSITSGKTKTEPKSKSRRILVHTSNKSKEIRNYEYNDFMGLRRSNQMLYQYVDEQKSLKFWKKVTFDLFGHMVFSSYLLYKNNTQKPLSRLDYTISLIEDLSKDWLGNQQSRPNITDIANIPTVKKPHGNDDTPATGPTGIAYNLLEKIAQKRGKNCCICSKMSSQAGGKRKKTTFMCIKCKKGLHPKCIPDHRC